MCYVSAHKTDNFAFQHLDLSYNQIYCWPGDVPVAASHGETVCYAEILNCDFPSSPASTFKSAKEGNEKR